jgi:hypothetical protein
LGPMANAICILLILQSEIGTQLLGVLRALGLRDSVYWISWYLPFILVSFVNALLGAITAQTLPTHAFESIYFGGVFASLFFLQLALASASFFVAALCSTAKRAVNWLILLMLISLWIPTLIVSGQSNEPYSYDIGGSVSPVGLLWQNAHTYSYSGAGATECSNPIMSEFQGNFYKTDAQRELVRDDEYHVGCHFLASWTSETWNPSNGGEKFGLGVLYLFPYLHFNGMRVTCHPKRWLSRPCPHLRTRREDLIRVCFLKPLQSRRNSPNTSPAIFILVSYPCPHVLSRTGQVRNFAPTSMLAIMPKNRFKTRHRRLVITAVISCFFRYFTYSWPATGLRSSLAETGRGRSFTFLFCQATG